MERMVNMCNLPGVIGVLFTLCPVTFGGGAFSGITFIILILSFKRKCHFSGYFEGFLAAFDHHSHGSECIETVRILRATEPKRNH
ncbi:MAG TPA: hypothetical protein PLC76_10545 [Saprospiraceae bacterium]|nr:hypothetical protein [Saprospiraceae bacterium]HRP85151.1 hypothetical protein [Saprospiraceae bacterium]